MRYWQHEISGAIVKSERHPSPAWRAISKSKYYRIKRSHLTQRAPDRAAECEKHVLYMACGYNYCPDCGKPRVR